jgi:anti-sigma B factor antagonist
MTESVRVRRVTDNDPILSLDVSTEGDEALVVLTGELDPHSTETLAEALHELRSDEAVQRVVIDLAGVSFIDSSGLRILLAADEELAGAGSKLVLRSPSDAVRRLFEITDLLDRLEIE